MGASLKVCILSLLAAVYLFVPTGSFATTSVFDAALNTSTAVNWTIDHVVTNTFHGQDIAKWVQSISNQVEQIVNQVTQIMHQVEMLERLGNPSYYVNMLGLNQILSSINRLEGGVGSVLSEVQASANGFSALRYSAQGLYSDLTQMRDQFGNAVHFDEAAFRKFGAVYDLSNTYNTYLQGYNQNAQKLGQDVQATMNKLNAESTQIGAEKLRGQIQALQWQQQAAADQAKIAADKVIVQKALNETNNAQMLEALREKQFQDTVLQNESAIMSGALMTGNLPQTSEMGPLKLQQ